MSAGPISRIALMGDVMLGRLVNDALQYRRPEFPWGNVLPLLQQVDFRICNLECVLSNITSTSACPPKVFHFRSDANNVAVLTAAGINAVSLANNHTLDFGVGAMFEMLDVLDQTGIAHCGAGANLSKASQPTCGTLENGTRIAMLSFTDNEPDWEAYPGRSGVFYVPVENGEDERIETLLHLTRAAREQAGIVIIAAHWGSNWGYRPPHEHIELAHKLIDAGADIIFGHSAHVFRGIEIYRARPIIYSTGDFIDDYAVDPVERNDRSFLFIIELSEIGITRVKLVPTVIRNFQAQLAEGVDASESIAKMTKLCTDLGTHLAWDNAEQCLVCEICSTEPASLR